MSFNGPPPLTCDRHQANPLPTLPPPYVAARRGSTNYCEAVRNCSEQSSSAGWWLLPLLFLCGCNIGFDLPVKPIDPGKYSPVAPIVRDAFVASEFSSALADEAAYESGDSAGSEKGSEIISGTLRQYERIWDSKSFEEYQGRLLKAVPAIELSGGKARDLTVEEIKTIREAR